MARPDRVRRQRLRDERRRRRAGGSGLGLASARAIVAAAGGDLRINSRPGAGTTIAVYLPALDGAGNRLALSPPAA
jgi:signal transduction histidine kinase